jgi:hypothetical protein
VEILAVLGLIAVLLWVPICIIYIFRQVFEFTDTDEEIEFELDDDYDEDDS